MIDNLTPVTENDIVNISINRGAPMSLTIDCKKHHNGVHILEVQGEITFENADEFREKIDSLCDENKAFIVVDLRDLKYMSSAGMGVLVHGLKKTRQLKGDLRISNLNSKMRRVFMITQFTHHFQVFKNTQEAAESFLAESSR